MTTPTDPVMTPEAAMREAAKLAMDDLFYDPHEDDQYPDDTRIREWASYGMTISDMREYIMSVVDKAIRALPLSTPVVAHQGAESDRQAIDNLLHAVGQMLLEAGEGFRIGRGAEVADAYEAALSPTPEPQGWRPHTPEERLASDILAELMRARAKFPGKNVTFAALVEEVGELATATFEEGRDRVRKEAVQVAVMAMRMVLDGDHTFDAWREGKGLDPLLPAAPMAGGGASDGDQRITEGWGVCARMGQSSRQGSMQSKR